MGEFVIKANPKDDLYVIWSTVVDDVTWIGTRAQVVEHLTTEFGVRFNAEEHAARADENGSSVQWSRTGFWDDEAIWVMGTRPEDSVEHYELPRVNLTAYAHALLIDDIPAAQALLRVVNDD